MNILQKANETTDQTAAIEPSKQLRSCGSSVWVISIFSRA